jgi:thymidylate synthase (FAD)
MMQFLLPHVEVIGHTVFHGVPDGLLPMEEEVARTDLATPRQAALLKIQAKGQDVGTDGDRLIECAGRSCYDSYGVGRNSADYHKHIAEVDHGSVCEHAWLSFFLSNLSRGLTHELVRHRVGVAISQRSTRYVDENESAWVLHPLIKAYIESGAGKALRAPNGEQVTFSMEQEIQNVITTSKRGYKDMVPKLQEFLVKKGIDKLTARKQARGAARGLLGNALMTEMVWSVNVRTLRGTILKQRANSAADAEIRSLAVRLWEEALPRLSGRAEAPTLRRRSRRRAVPAQQSC